MIGFAIVLFLCAGPGHRRRARDQQADADRRRRRAGGADRRGQHRRRRVPAHRDPRDRPAARPAADRRLPRRPRLRRRTSGPPTSAATGSRDGQRHQQDLHPQPVQRPVPGARLGRGRPGHRPGRPRASRPRREKCDEQPDDPRPRPVQPAGRAGAPRRAAAARALSALALLGARRRRAGRALAARRDRPVPDVAADQGDAHRAADLHHAAQRAAVRRSGWPGCSSWSASPSRSSRPVAAGWRSRCRWAVRCRSSRVPWSGRCCWPRSISGPAASAMAPVEHTGGRGRRPRPSYRTPPQAAPDAEQTAGRAARRARDHRAGAPGRAQGLHRGGARRTATTTTSGTSPSGTLGDGRRYKEIYELNKGLVQPDGRKLELARLIQPGWNLVDARGRRRRPAHGQLRRRPATPGARRDRTAVGHGAPRRAAAISEQGVQEMPGGLLGTGLLAAAVARGAGLRASSPDRRGLRRRRGRGRAPWRGDPVAGRASSTARCVT